MKLKFETCTDSNCTVIINDRTEVSDSGYIPESSNAVSKNRFKKSQTKKIGLIEHNWVSGQKIYNPTITSDDNIKLKVGYDGWFTVYMIILPTEEWFNSELDKDNSSLVLYDCVYYIDDNNYIYKYENGSVSQSSVSEVVERNPYGTTISKIKEDLVSICFLKKCYISLCQQIFQDRGFSECWNKNTLSSDLIFRRDVVWMTINIIKYMVELNQLAEAQRIIENIGGCNGLCKSELNRISESNCGCS